MENRTFEETNESKSSSQDDIASQQDSVLITQPPSQYKSLQPSLHLTTFTTFRRNIHKQTTLLPSSIIDLRRIQSLKQLCVIAIFSFASKKLSSNPKKSIQWTSRSIIKSHSMATTLRQISPFSQIKPSSKVLICSSKIRQKKKNETDIIRWLISISNIIYKAKKKYYSQKKSKALQSFENVLNSKVQDLNIDLKNINIEDLQCGLDHLSLLTNINTKQKDKTKKHSDELSIMNKDIHYMTIKNPEYQYLVIQQTVNVIKNKTLAVRTSINELEKNIGQLSYRDFRDFYKDLRKINIYLGEILSILFKSLSIEEIFTHQQKEQTNRTGIAIKNSYSSYYQIVSISFKSIIQTFNKLQTDLINVSTKYFTKIKSRKMSNQIFQKFLQAASKLRYHLIYVNKGIDFLNRKQSQQKQLKKTSKLNKSKLNSTFKVLSQKYFFNQIQSQQSQKQQKLSHQILFQHHKHRIADNKLQIKKKIYNNPNSSRSIRILKLYKNVNAQTGQFQ